MKIQTLTVVDEDGVTHSWTGIEGHVHVRSQSKKGQPYQQAVDAHLTLQDKGVIKEPNPE